jgi:hypothetical protein
MLTTLFLILNFYVEVGRLHIVNNNRIIVVANHRIIHERITTDIELIEIMQILRKNQIVDFPYNPNRYGRSNHEYLDSLFHRDSLQSHRVILMARLYYWMGKLVKVEVWEQDR